jgi:hypothetical protein
MCGTVTVLCEEAFLLPDEVTETVDQFFLLLVGHSVMLGCCINFHVCEAIKKEQYERQKKSDRNKGRSRTKRV